MKKITKWLKNNEVYFTTVCTILLSIMAIIVSILSNNVADRQYQMDYFEKLPDFQLIQIQKLNEETGKYETQLNISKISGKAKNIEIQNITLLDTQYGNTAGDSKKAQFLITNFYGIGILPDGTDNLILSFTGNNNNSNTMLLESYFEEMIEDRNQIVFFEWRSYVKIKYLNFELEPKVEYFDVSSVSGKLINNDTLDKYFDKTNLFNSENTINLNDVSESKNLFKYLVKIK